MLIIYRAILGMALLLATIGDSSEKSQRRSHQMRINHPEATIAQPKSDDNQRGTEQSPLIVKVAPTAKTEDQRADEAKERDRIAESDRKKEKSDSDLVKYTGELASFTKYLVGATVALVIATIGLGVAAFFQSRDMKRSLEIAADGVKVARDEFNATHRPKLRIRLIRLDRIDGPQIRILYTVVNIGETLAILNRHEVTLYIKDADVKQGALAECPELAGGESFICYVTITFDCELRWAFAESGEIKIRGRIEYKDIRGITRRTGFFRTYDHGRGYFRKRHDTEDEEEYED